MKFISLTALLVALSLTAPAQDYQKVAESLLENNKKGIPVIKDFDYGFITTLDKRGEPKLYTRQNSNNFEYIGMPICGIATGQLYIGGDGALWFWDIFNTANRHGQYLGEEAYEFPYKRSNPNAKGTNNISQGFAIKVDNKIWKLNRDGFKNITFRGEYPIAKVSYQDEWCPIETTLEAFSPFIPLDVERSSYPATILNYTFTNTSESEVTFDVAGWLENAAMCRSNDLVNGTLLTNEAVEMPEGKAIFFSAQNNEVDPTGFYDFGDMTLTMLGDDIKTNVGYKPNAPESLFEQSSQKSITLGDREWPGPHNGSLAKEITLGAGESTTVEFIMTWYFPNSGVLFGGRRSYGDRFASSQSVTNDIIENLDYLSQTTRKWNTTWYDSSLPYWFLDRTFINTSILATQTCFLFDDGRFYAFEGGLQGHGTCTHVWGYEQAMIRLFPELEQNLREKTDFVAVEDGGGFIPETGKMNFRGKYNDVDAVDGTSGVILRSYLIHKMSTDDTFLKNNYANIKKALQYLTSTNDPNHDGILTGWQHNTLDSHWNGKVAWLSGYYQTALRACAIMAEDYGDTQYSKECMQMAVKGKEILETELFNGEYFFQLPEADGSKTVGIQNGCEYSQLLGQSQAYQAGLGKIVDSEKVTSALNALWKYNFTTDVGPYRERNTGGRWYAMPGEGGLIACTWPNGGQEALENDDPRFAAYNHECQNGYEYAATSLMMWHDQPYRALAHTFSMKTVLDSFVVP